MISNATPIICLAKINQLEILKKLFSYITIPETVKEEILFKEKPDYLIIDKAIKQDWIKILNPKQEIDLKLGKGENSAINLAKETNDKILLDDALAIKVAKTLNIEFIRTTSIIFLALKKQIINKKEAIDILNKLIDIGYYIAPKYYSKILTKLTS